VEIARLSLWLRTATKGRKLNDLSSNIKCGNSLIDDPAVAGDKAFDWKKEFPRVFAKGGFDVVIGNPPYLRVQGLRESFEKESEYFETKFESATGRFDIYILFIEKACSLIADRGLASMILPHKFLVGSLGEGVRSFLAKQRAVKSLIHFGAEMVFDDASTYTCILTLSKKNEVIEFAEIKPDQLFEPFVTTGVQYAGLDSKPWSLHASAPGSVIAKLKEQRLTLADVLSAVRTGIDSGDDDLFVLEGAITGDRFLGYSKKVEGPVELEAAMMKPMLRGEDVKKYAPLVTSKYVIYPHHEVDGKTVPYEEEQLRSEFPLTYQYFLPFREELIARKIRKKTNPNHWFSLHRSREMSIYEGVKLITPEISLGSNLTYDDGHHYHNTKCYSLVKNRSVEVEDLYLLAVLNSNVLWYYLKSTGYVLRGGYFTFKTNFLEPFPIALPSAAEQKPLAERAGTQLERTAELNKLIAKFTGLLRSKYTLHKLSRNLENWPALDLKGFLQELKKAKVSLSLAEEAEWLGYCTEQQATAHALQAQIDMTDKEIDALVYKLYGLTEEEVRVVEGK